jgi:hypothetical protein
MIGILDCEENEIGGDFLLPEQLVFSQDVGTGSRWRILLSRAIILDAARLVSSLLSQLVHSRSCAVIARCERELNYEHTYVEDTDQSGVSLSSCCFSLGWDFVAIQRYLRTQIAVGYTYVHRHRAHCSCTPRPVPGVRVLIPPLPFPSSNTVRLPIWNADPVPVPILILRQPKSLCVAHTAI